MARRAAAAVAGAGAGLRQHVDAVGLRVGVAAGRAAAPRFVTSHYHPPLFHPVDEAGSRFANSILTSHLDPAPDLRGVPEREVILQILGVDFMMLAPKPRAHDIAPPSQLVV